MKKILLSLLLFSICITSFCKTWTIINAGTTFSPASVTITLGDSVNFSLGSIHNAVEVSQATWNANGTTPLPGFSTPFSGGLVLPAQLTVGTHYYVCTNHASSGMKGIIIVQNSSGIKENSSKINLSIYPNPSNGKFQLEINSLQSTKDYNLEVYDVLGNKIRVVSKLAQQISNKIDFSDFPKGIYFIRLYDGAEICDKKIIIQ